ncbi:MAG: geranylgeranyl reductase family protein [Desulfovibrio sp.]
MEKFDVVVIGGGPSGAVAATLLAKKGLKVALLDKKTFPRKKICGGLLTQKAIAYLQEIYSVSPQELMESNIINFSSCDYSMFHKKDRFLQGTVASPFHLVDRTCFDNYLLEKAKEAGAQCFEGIKVLGLSPRTGHVYTEEGGIFHGSHIIGADGANSVVRQHFPLEKKDWTSNLAGAVEIRVPHSEFPFNPEHPELYIDVVESGYGWVFPNKTETVVGICGLQKKNKNFHELFRAYISMLGVEDVDGFLKKHPLKGHPLPYGNMVKQPVFGKTILVGDAGGFVETLLGEGIFYAIATGKYAAEAILQAGTAGKSVEQIYTERLKKTVIPEIQWSKKLRFVLFNTLKWIGIKPIARFNTVLSGPLGEMVHGSRSYRWFLKKKW